MNSLRMDELVNALFRKGWAVELKPVPGVPKKGWHGFVVVQDSHGCALAVSHEFQHNKNNGKRAKLAADLAALVVDAPTMDELTMDIPL